MMEFKSLTAELEVEEEVLKNQIAGIEEKIGRHQSF